MTPTGYDGPATLRFDDGTEHPVTAYIRVNDANVLASWEGSLDASEDVAGDVSWKLFNEDGAKLTLDDGRSAQVRSFSATPTDHSPTRIAFTGSGQLK